MYVCSLCIYMFMYAKHRFLEKFYLYMFSDLVHFRLVSFLEKFYIFRKKRKKKKKNERKKENKKSKKGEEEERKKRRNK